MGSYRSAKRRRTYYRRPMRKKVTTGRGITTQRDRATQYVKKRMPRQKKRQWISFSRKVQAVLQKNLGTRTVVFNDTGGINLPNTSQGIYTCCLYGFEGSTDASTNSGFKDMQTLLINDPTITKTGTPPINPVNGKIMFKSAVLDMTICNAKLEGENGPVELDIYEIHHKKFIDNLSLLSTFIDAETDTGTIAGAGTGLQLTQRGVTPFDLPMAMSQDGLTIYKKTKYFIPVNGTVTYQIRDPRNISLSGEYFEGNSGFAWPGKTRTLLLVAKNVVGFNQTTGLNIGVTRKYSYVAESTNSTLDQLL